jgi:transposase InsO family protein
MPWEAVSIVEQREQLVLDCLAGRFAVTEACERYGISRKTGYKWIERFRKNGRAGLEDESRRPDVSPNETPGKVVTAIVELREKHPTWGAKKLLAKLKRKEAKTDWPAPSTVALILKRQGLVTERRRRRHRPGRLERPGVVVATRPNLVWTVDFKGHFRTHDGRYCYPLTVMDRYSRYLLECHGLVRPTYEATARCFRGVFDQYGLPDVLRSDNGTPFCGPGLAGLSRLAVWWIRLGIRLDRIHPASPQENGSHERFHRTLKRETARPPARTCRQQNARFGHWGYEYNYERPHEALGQIPPGEIYEPSARPYPSQLPDPGYPGHFEARHVGSNGTLSLGATVYFLSETLDGQDVGLEEIDDGLWTVYLVDVPIARINERTKTVEPAHERRGDLSVTDSAA